MEHILHQADSNYQVFSLGRSTVADLGHHWMCLHVLMCLAAECDAPSISAFPQLFELLGPEGLEMISTLLQCRAAIVDSFLSIPNERSGYLPGEATTWQL